MLFFKYINNVEFINKVRNNTLNQLSVKKINLKIFRKKSSKRNLDIYLIIIQK